MLNCRQIFQYYHFNFSYGHKMWVTKTAEELIWGYDEPLFELAKMFLPNPPSYDKFGFFTDVSISNLAMEKKVHETIVTILDGSNVFFLSY